MSLYDSTVEMLSMLSDKDLEQVNVVIRQFVVRKQDDKDAFFHPLTKDEMLGILAESREQIRNGECENSETMERKLAEEFGF